MEFNFGYLKTAEFFSYDQFDPLNPLQKLMGQKQKAASGRAIATDNNNYWIVHACNQMDPWVATDAVYVFAKSPVLTNQQGMDILKAANKFGYEGAEFGVVDHDPAKCKEVTTD